MRRRRETVRAAAVAGTFYPARGADLAALVDRLVAEASGRFDAAPVALVVPHAGYQYSGPVAAAAYAGVVGCRPDRVVLVGPAHFVPLPGLGVPTVDTFATPLGRVPVDQATCGRLTATMPSVGGTDQAHAREHSLEVQLPFLQRVLHGDWSLVPIAVGLAEPDDVADVVDAALFGSSALLVVSTDLSHGLDHPTAVDRDSHTVDALIAGRVEAIGDSDACGVSALRGVVAWAGRHRLTPRLLDRRTSADATGDPTRVVGYAAVAIESGPR